MKKKHHTCFKKQNLIKLTGSPLYFTIDAPLQTKGNKVLRICNFSIPLSSRLQGAADGLTLEKALKSGQNRKERPISERRDYFKKRKKGLDVS
ncbi:hypothetical protein KHS38_21860 [Mucilaginibacter sp. Bleaf8]|uniref:hypothetical protein n=1 Tax=Mucilaginibacter sp. Bleaf8 TaxID=2834430 RepID=UPI001BCBA0B0|nr:hypothetical protein [Mucilaginibacter sp. Bleaf8]MBS7567066.1 hypothetical protein [Mucilaginibacter sp. Bleaf8]